MAKKSVHIGGFQGDMFARDAEWTIPTELPDLRGRVKELGYDTETRDPNLNEMGAGFIRGDAYCIGHSVAWESEPNKYTALYLPIHHDGGGNMDPNNVHAWLNDHFRDPTVSIVGGNLMYDYEVARSCGVELAGNLYDIMVAEALLDEERTSYSVDAISWDYLQEGKKEVVLNRAAADYRLDPKKDMWRLHSKYVGEYAEADAVQPLRVWKLQRPKLIEEDLWDVFELETDLMKILYYMRERGVRVDLDKAEQIRLECLQKEEDLHNAFRDEVGLSINFSSPKHLVEAFNHLGVDYPRTVKGNPSFAGDFLDTFTEGPLRYISEYRTCKKMRSDFIDGMILGMSVNGRLHTNWFPVRGQRFDGKVGGNRGGRIACAKPNLQQIPSRDPYWGPLIRSCFIPDEGGQWIKLDYSQQEPRWIMHFAYITEQRGAAAAVDRFCKNPRTDYHQMVADMTNMSRNDAKPINLGIPYGMQANKLAIQTGWDPDRAKVLLAQYHDKLPYVKGVMEDAEYWADRRGYVKTYLGRKKRFEFWEPDNWNLKMKVQPVKSKEAAIAHWGTKVVRANLNKALNAIIQGSSGDQIKLAIRELYKENLMPHIQVYDEINSTIYSDSQAKRIQEIMETIIPDIVVPMVADIHIGPSWGEAEK
jgi:DNA polymerase I-like protein with 3'-5' exonuclease and polymerase domains